MEMQDEIIINAPREKVFEALNDPEILKQCIPGCESLTKKSDTELEAVASLKIGPVKAKFKGLVTLSDLNPPESYTLSGEGKGGAAGFAKGSAEVKLTEDGNATRMFYAAKADVGGKMAQLGGRLIDSTANKLAGQFFSKFSEIVGEEVQTEESPDIEDVKEAVQEAIADSRSGGAASKNWVWYALGAAALGLIVIFAVR